MDNIKIGNYIKEKRIEQKLTQKDVANMLNISFQAVSKWEKGETLPDTSILLELANILNTSVDLLLSGGNYINNERKLLKIKDIVAAFQDIENIKNAFGENSLFYRGMIEGISTKMNFDFEDALNNHLDILYTEVILQSIMFDNKKVNMDEVKEYIKNDRLIAIIEKKNNI